MGHAWAMEAEAAERYEELSAQMEAHHNREVAELFARLARIEGRHRDQIAAQMGWREPPASGAFRWETPEGLETTDYGDLHYLMQPHQALTLALHNEERAARFFEQLAGARVPDVVQSAAAAMAAEEREHVRLVIEWLAKYPPAPADWDEDPDPPVVAD